MLGSRFVSGSIYPGQLYTPIVGVYGGHICLGKGASWRMICRTQWDSSHTLLCISGAIVSMAFDFKYEQYLSISRIVYVQVRSSTILDIINQVYIKRSKSHKYHISTVCILHFCRLLGWFGGLPWNRSCSLTLSHCRRNIGLIDAGPLLKRTAVELKMLRACGMHRKLLWKCGDASAVVWKLQVNPSLSNEILEEDRVFEGRCIYIICSCIFSQASDTLNSCFLQKVAPLHHLNCCQLIKEGFWFW